MRRQIWFSEILLRPLIPDSTMSVPLLPLPAGCIQGTLIRRFKRFFVEFSLVVPGCAANKQILLAHTNNSGSMLGLLREGNLVLVSPATTPGRKLPYTLELLCPVIPFTERHTPPSMMWIGVNTLTPNRLLRAAFMAGRLPWAEGYTNFRAEARRGQSRLDALLTGPCLPPLWIECKNVTMVEDEVAAFPDAVTTRGQKHVREMMDIVRCGERAAFFYCIQRTDARCFGPADYVDADYAALFYEAHACGVEAHPHVCPATRDGIDIGNELPLALPVA